MGDLLLWLVTHPFDDEAWNIVFWLSCFGILVIRIVLWFGGRGSGRIKG